jgi:hypothetical protein
MKNVQPTLVAKAALLCLLPLALSTGLTSVASAADERSDPAVREQIKKYGGEFDGERSVWVLLVPKKNVPSRAAFEKWIDDLSSDGVRVEWV